MLEVRHLQLVKADRRGGQRDPGGPAAPPHPVGAQPPAARRRGAPGDAALRPHRQADGADPRRRAPAALGARRARGARARGAGDPRGRGPVAGRPPPHHPVQHRLPLAALAAAALPPDAPRRGPAGGGGRDRRPLPVAPRAAPSTSRSSIARFATPRLVLRPALPRRDGGGDARRATGWRGDPSSPPRTSPRST